MERYILQNRSMTPIRSLFVAIVALTVFTTYPGHAADVITSGVLVEKQKSISGNWSIEKVGESRFIVLAENFKAKNGPDLKIFLSSATLSDVTGKTATKGSALISELKSVKGIQRYSIPQDVDLSQYKSLLIHCEKYAVLWGGGEL